MNPIFIGWTRSFWLTVGGILMLLEAGVPVIRGVISLVALVITLDVDQATRWVSDVAPAILWLAALNERRGNNRPYSINPKDK